MIALNPLNLLNVESLVAISVTAVLFGASGFVGGCVHKEKYYAAEKLKQVKAAVRLENKDATLGVNAANQLRKKENEIQTNTAVQIAKASGKPIIVVKYKACEQVPAAKNPASENSDTSTPKGTVNETEVVDANFSGSFVSMYDSTLQPRNAKVRTRADETPASVPVNAGLEVIGENNGQCAAIREQLNALIDRIQQKQQVFSDAFSKE